MAISDDAQLDLEQRKISIEEKRLAAELTRAQIAKNPDWDKDVEYSHQAHEAGSMFATILEYVREQKEGFDDE